MAQDWSGEKSKRKPKKFMRGKLDEWREEAVQDLVDCMEKVKAEQGDRPKLKPETEQGSPCAKSWDEAWIATIEAAEARLGRRICGARTVAGNPCELGSNHENGRCRFHGGFDLTGARHGNRNAVIHGLYSRRLKVCDARCPRWDECPCAGPDVDALPPAERPTCPYEQTEYNAALSDALARAATKFRPDPLDRHIAHTFALLQVMLDRAAIALRNGPLVDEVTASSAAYTMASSKPSAHLEAFLRITAEYRRVAALLTPRNPVEPAPEQVLDRNWQTVADTKLTPEAAVEMHREPFSIDPEAKRYVRQAVRLAESNARGCYRPNGQTLPEDAVESILGYMNQRPP